MDEIVKLRDKYVAPNISELIEFVNECLIVKLRVVKEQERFIEDKKKIDELTSRVATVKDKLNMEKLVLESKIHDLSKHEEQLKDLEAEEIKFINENLKLDIEKNKLRMIKPNQRDQHIMDMGKKKLNLYKQLTRIRWDYKVIEEVTKGYVTDKKDYIHAFCFDKKENSQGLADLLWNEVYLSTGHKILDDDDDSKENMALNK